MTTAVSIVLYLLACFFSAGFGSAAAKGDGLARSAAILVLTLLLSAASLQIWGAW